ncbi:MAG TPA: hypothetical protein VK929_06290 [Longimicrobiales bacterium]|nr:hypothetical protein [Longimicrobiales bacterium]
MKNMWMAVVAGGLAMSACATMPVEEVQPAPQPAPPPPDASYIPIGTHLEVELQDELNTTTSRVGDSFVVTVTEPLVAANGQTVVPEGTRIQGMVTGVAQPGDRDPAVLRLNFLRVEVNGAWHPLTASIAGTEVPMDARGPGARQHAQAAATGAVAGAVLGAVITGRLRESLIGAALGAGAGTIISLGMSGPNEAVLPAGTQMTLRTEDRVNLR